MHDEGDSLTRGTCMRVIARVKDVLTKCGHLFTFAEGQVKPGKRTSHTSLLTEWAVRPFQGAGLLCVQVVLMET